MFRLFTVLLTNIINNFFLLCAFYVTAIIDMNKCLYITKYFASHFQYSLNSLSTLIIVVFSDLN